ncbi:MAG: hypothetical protein ACOYEV_12480 [Candidatus Nanopelagicales bacterium]
MNITNCSTESIGTGTLREWDYFRVHVIWRGIAMYASHNMSISASKNGGFQS